VFIDLLYNLSICVAGVLVTTEDEVIFIPCGMLVLDLYGYE